MAQQPHFFQAIINSQNAQNAQIQKQTPEYINHNETVLEIVNNWKFVGWLMCRHREGWLKEIDQMENLWLNFIVRKNINIELYKNEEEFIKDHWRFPAN